MQTHTKEAATTVVTFLVLVGTVHAGIWFHLFGIPDLVVLNWPFHYFWFVIGAWVSILVIYAVYHRYIEVIEAEKSQLHDEFGTPEGRRTDSGETVADSGGD